MNQHSRKRDPVTEEDQCRNEKSPAKRRFLLIRNHPRGKTILCNPRSGWQFLAATDQVVQINYSRGRVRMPEQTSSRCNPSQSYRAMLNHLLSHRLLPALSSM
jgi:hypothetical protein